VVDVPFRTLLHDADGRNAQEGLWVVDEPDRWARYCDASWMSEPPPVPEVDFNAEVVLVLASGGRGTGGFGVEILNLVDDGDTLVVYAVEQRLGPDRGATQAVTYPHHAVAIARRPEGPLRLVLEITWWW